MYYMWRYSPKNKCIIRPQLYSLFKMCFLWGISIVVIVIHIHTFISNSAPLPSFAHHITHTFVVFHGCRRGSCFCLCYLFIGCVDNQFVYIFSCFCVLLFIFILLLHFQFALCVWVSMRRVLCVCMSACFCLL